MFVYCTLIYVYPCTKQTKLYTEHKRFSHADVECYRLTDSLYKGETVPIQYLIMSTSDLEIGGPIDAIHVYSDF